MGNETTPVIFIIGFLIMLLNSILLVALYKKLKRNNTLYDVFLISFTIANAIQGYITYPFRIYILLTGRISSDVPCVFAAAMMLISSVSTIWHLVILSLERLISMKYPQFYMNHSTSYVGKGVGVAIPWTFGLIWGLAPLAGWNRYALEFHDRPNCNIDFRDRSHSGISYMCMLFVWNYIIPFIIFTYAFYNFRKELRSISQAATDVAGREADIAVTTKRTQRKQTMLIVAMVTAFMIVWTPYAIIFIYRSLANVEVAIELYESAGILAKVSCVFNPIIHGFVYKNIRKAVVQLFARSAQVSNERSHVTVDS